jgi:hypothetical protein
MLPIKSRRRKTVILRSGVSAPRYILYIHVGTIIFYYDYVPLAAGQDLLLRRAAEAVSVLLLLLDVDVFGRSLTT